MEGEKRAPTQPFPLKPAPLSRMEVNEDLVTDISKEAREFAMQRFRSVRGGMPFAPPCKQGTIYSPGTLGGALWGGCAYDPSSQKLFVNTSELPSIAELRDGRPQDPFRFTMAGYEKFVDH